MCGAGSSVHSCSGWRHCATARGPTPHTCTELDTVFWNCASEPRHWTPLGQAEDTAVGGRNRAASALMRGIEGECTFGGLLREHRLAAGLAQGMLAERSGLSSRGILDLERGLSQPRRDTLLRLEAALRLSPEEQAALHAVAKPTPRRRTPLPTSNGTATSSASRRYGQPGSLPLLATSSASRRYGQPGSLPLLATSFIGRQRELAELQQLLARARLVTLTGPPGTGKTRLVLQVAGETGSRFARLAAAPAGAAGNDRLELRPP